MNLKRGGVLLLSTLLALVPISDALAGVQKFVDGDRTKVWIDGLTPGVSYEYNIDGYDKVKRRTVNACGWVQLSFSYGETPPTSVRIASDQALVASATATATGSLAMSDRFCKNGIVVDALGNAATATAPFQDPSGKYTFPGFTQNETQYVQYVGVPDVRKKKANNCGLISFTHDATEQSKNFTSFTFDGSSYSLGTLTNTHEKTCKKYKDGTYRVLIPTAI